VTLALLLACVTVAACRDQKGAPLAVARPTIADSADQILFNSRTLITDLGLQRAEVFSDTAFFFDQNTRLEMRGGPTVRGIFFSSTGAQDAILTSHRALYNTRQGVLEASGDVLVVSTDGRKLKTPFLRFDQRQNKISSDSAFVLTEPGREVRGIGFVSDPDMQNINVLKVQSSKVGPVAVPEQ
jgi:LPS export ABC transporter protein LptC